jgi:hypothetical protein
VNREDPFRVEFSGPDRQAASWEEIAMIREAQPFEIENLRAPFAPGPATTTRSADETPRPADHHSAEQEITRLTWSVLDGSASLNDRQRLAELVNAQHAVRRRIDR